MAGSAFRGGTWRFRSSRHVDVVNSSCPMRRLITDSGKRGAGFTPHDIGRGTPRTELAKRFPGYDGCRSPRTTLVHGWPRRTSSLPVTSGINGWPQRSRSPTIERNVTSTVRRKRSWHRRVYHGSCQKHGSARRRRSTVGAPSTRPESPTASRCMGRVESYGPRTPLIKTLSAGRKQITDRAVCEFAAQGQIPSRFWDQAASARQVPNSLAGRR